MKKLELNQMENVEGGTACGTLAAISLIASIGSCFGPIGLAICGPTAIGCGIVSVVACN